MSKPEASTPAKNKEKETPDLPSKNLGAVVPASKRKRQDAGLAELRAPLGRRRQQRELYAAAHRVYAFGADAHAIAEFPDERIGLLALGAAAAAFVTGDGDDGVVAFAIEAVGACGFFECVDGEEAFDEDVKELDKATVFLDGDDQGVILIAKMLFHELRGFPGDEFALGVGGATLGLGSFGSDFLKVIQRIKSGLDADGGLDLSGRFCVGIGERPFEYAMNDQIGIAADGGGEVGVLLEAESEMAKRIGGVAGLL